MKKIILILVLIMHFSCSDEAIQKNVDNPPSDIPILSFKNAEEMNSYLTAISKNEGGINGRGKSFGFESFDDVYKKAIGEIGMAQTSEEISGLLKAYADVVRLSDSTFAPAMQNKLYRSICNRERIYESEGFMHKVLDDEFVVITESKNLNILRKISIGDKLNPSVFKTAKYSDLKAGSQSTNNGRIQTDVCANNMEYYLEYDPSGCKNDRRVYAHANAGWIISGNNYTPHLLAETYARRRAGTLCYWYLYNTVFHTRDADLRVKMVINGVTVNFVLSKANGAIPDYNIAGTIGEEPDHILYNDNLQNGPTYWSSGPNPVISFSKAFFEAASRGTGDNNWVSVDCLE